MSDNDLINMLIRIETENVKKIAELEGRLLVEQAINQQALERVEKIERHIEILAREASIVFTDEP